MTKAMLFDSSKCMACRGCQVACKQWWELPAVATKNQGTYENPADLSGETWNKIMFREIGNNGTARWLFTRQACMHCTEAACVKVCPTYARGYHDLGFVTIDQERCIGCGRCLLYCPFGVPKLAKDDISPRISIELNTPRAVIYSCIFCRDRIEDGLTPACAKTCPPGAVEFGERAGLVAKGKAKVTELQTIYPRANLYGESELGGLQVMYILTDEPSTHGLPDEPKLGTYPQFDKAMLPSWYSEAIANGNLATFPSGASPEWYLQPPSDEEILGEADKTEALAAAKTNWGLWGSLIGVGVIGLGAGLWWLTRRREEVRKE